MWGDLRRVLLLLPSVSHSSVDESASFIERGQQFVLTTLVQSYSVGSSAQPQMP